MYSGKSLSILLGLCVTCRPSWRAAAVPAAYGQVFHGAEERRIPGNTLAVQPDKPYQVRRDARGITQQAAGRAMLTHRKTSLAGGRP